LPSLPNVVVSKEARPKISREKSRWNATVFWARRVHAGETLCDVCFDFDDDTFKPHDATGIDAGKHDGSLGEEGETSTFGKCIEVQSIWNLLAIDLK
jgi:hypothetical protein